MNSPAPSRRCSGSSSRAVCPMWRTVAPTGWASPSQAAATPLPRAVKSSAIGPGPLRTARGAGRFALEDERVDDEDFRRVWLPDDRVLEGAVLLPLLFRDAGGEDVRVAMVMRVSDHPTSLTLHTPGSTPVVPADPGILRSRTDAPRGGTPAGAPPRLRSAHTGRVHQGVSVGIS